MTPRLADIRHARFASRLLDLTVLYVIKEAAGTARRYLPLRRGPIVCPHNGSVFPLIGAHMDCLRAVVPFMAALCCRRLVRGRVRPGSCKGGGRERKETEQNQRR